MPHTYYGICKIRPGFGTYHPLWTNIFALLILLCFLFADQIQWDLGPYWCHLWHWLVGSDSLSGSSSHSPKLFITRSNCKRRQLFLVRPLHSRRNWLCGPPRALSCCSALPKTFQLASSLWTILIFPVVTPYRMNLSLLRNHPSYIFPLCRLLLWLLLFTVTSWLLVRYLSRMESVSRGFLRWTMSWTNCLPCANATVGDYECVICFPFVIDYVAGLSPPVAFEKTAEFSGYVTAPNADDINDTDSFYWDQ